MHALEIGGRELRQQAFAERLGGDPGAIGDEKYPAFNFFMIRRRQFA
jgi:hypothetical protein